MSLRKKAQDADAAATLIGVILIILVFFVLLIPEEERQKILLDNETSVNETTTTTDKNVLLRETSLRLDVTKEKEKDISITNFELRETKPDIEIASFNRFRVTKGLFSKDFKEFVFLAGDADNIQSGFLSFQTEKQSGILKIKLNNYYIFEGSVDANKPVKVDIKKELLQKDNKITFEVSGSLFENKEYEINDVKIIARMIESERLISFTTFNIDKDTLNSVESGDLNYYIGCDQARVSVLDIILNNKKIVSGVPLCDNLNKVVLSESDFVEGKNTLVFKAQKGSYDFSETKIKLKFSETKELLKYFDVSTNLFSDLIDDKKKVVLLITFVDDKEDKEALLNINEGLKNIDQKESKFSMDISNYLVKGNNYIKLVPKTPLDIVELKVKVE